MALKRFIILRGYIYIMCVCNIAHARMPVLAGGVSSAVAFAAHVLVDHE